MLEIIVIWATVAMLGFTLAAPLGPVNVEMIKQGLNKLIPQKSAWFAAMLTGIGAMSGDFIVATSALMIGGEILNNIFSNPLIKLCLFSVNILILGYLGLSTLFQNPKKQMNELGKSVEKKLNSEIVVGNYFFFKRYITGLSLVLSSPWSYLWWVSAGTIILFGDFNVPDFYSRLTIVFMFLSGIFIWFIILCSILAIIGRSPKPVYFSWITKGTAIVLLLLIILPAIKAWEIVIELLN